MGALGRTASLKFLGTTALLLIGQVQPQIINLWVPKLGAKTSNMQDFGEQIQDHLPNWISWGEKESTLGNLTRGVVKTSLSSYQANLLHSSLLCYWCLLFTLINLVFWANWAPSRRMLEDQGYGNRPLIDDSGDYQ